MGSEGPTTGPRKEEKGDGMVRGEAKGKVW